MSTLKTHNLQSPDAGSVNISLTPNAGMIVAGLSTYSNQINVGSNIKLGTAGVVTATSFVGSGANLSSLPAQATIANNADNRVITGGSGVNLNGESNFTYDGDIATITRSANAAGGLSIVNTNNSQASAHARLELSAGDNSSAIMRMECNGHSNELIADGSGNFRIDDNGTERLRIASDGNMGLGLTPAYSGLFGGAQRTFHIGGTAAPCLRITSSSSGQADLVVHAGNSGRRADIANMATNGTISIWTKPSSGSIAERMRIGSTGIIDAPAQAGFYARLNTNKNDKTGDGTYYTVEWDTDSGSICYDQHNTFSTSTGLYTIPTGGDGVYQFATAVCLSTDVYNREGEAWFVVGGLRIFFDRRHFPSATGTITGFYGSCIAKMTAGQTIGVQVFVSGGAKNVDVFGAGAADHISWFSGRKIA